MKINEHAIRYMTTYGVLVSTRREKRMNEEDCIRGIATHMYLTR